MTTLLRSRPMMSEYLAARTGFAAGNVIGKASGKVKQLRSKGAHQSKLPLGLLAGASAGAALMYIFDPQSGPGRRAKIRDKSSHAARTVCDKSQALWSDLAQRGQGLYSEGASLFSREPLSDEKLQARVRSRLGRLTRRAQGIEVKVNEGVVALSGSILASEAARVLKKIGRMRGVRNVDDRLDWHHDESTLPSVQAVGAKLQSALSDWPASGRVAAGTGGAALLAGGLYKRGGLGWGLAALGFGLLAAGALARGPQSSGKSGSELSGTSPS